MPKVLLAIKEVWKIYKTEKTEIQALKGISFSIYEGEILGLLGPNGSGKTTLSSIIATLHPPTSGDVLFKDKSIFEYTISYRKFLGFCPQKPNFEKMLTVKENLIFAGRYYGLSGKVIKERVNTLLEQFDLDKYSSSTPDVLSGGYKQRLLIARTLVHNPALVILDEPTVAMDPHIRRELWDIINQLKKSGVTILLTTHYLDEAEVLSDRVCVLDQGKIRFLDTPDNLKLAFKRHRLEDVFLDLMKEQQDNTIKE